MEPHRVADDLADALARVQRRVGVLEDHLDLARAGAQLAAREPDELLALELDRARRSARAAADRAAQRRLAAAGLPDEAERLALGQVKLTSSTARTRPTSRSIRIPDLIGKCLTRWSTSSSGAPSRSRLIRAQAPARSGPLDLALLLLFLRSRASSGRRASGASARRASSGGSSPHASNACGQRGRNRQPPAAAQQRWRLAGDLWAGARGGPVETGQRAQQAPGVGVLGVVEDLLDRPLLDDLPGVHDQHAVGDLGDDAEIVGDQDHRQVAVAVQLFDQLQDLRLDRDVEGGGRLVGDQDLGLERQRHRDHRPLAHPAGELVRVVSTRALGVRDPDRPQQLDRRVSIASAL